MFSENPQKAHRKVFLFLRLVETCCLACSRSMKHEKWTRKMNNELGMEWRALNCTYTYIYIHILSLIIKRFLIKIC